MLSCACACARVCARVCTCVRVCACVCVCAGTPSIVDRFNKERPVVYNTFQCYLKGSKYDPEP
jgi:hypothetical protein